MFKATGRIIDWSDYWHWLYLKTRYIQTGKLVDCRGWLKHQSRWYISTWHLGGLGQRWLRSGHASAPNRKLQLALSRYLPVVVASEFRFSQTSTCHHCCVRPVRRQDQKQRATVLKCVNCSTLHSRDFNAAHVIADMFLVMQATNSSELPDWIKSEAIRQSLIPRARCVYNLKSQDTYTDSS